MDFTGTGNTLNLQHPRVLQLIMDSLRYWVLEMHVDGFRFDLASALARELLRGRPAGLVLRHHRPGSGALAGQAHRRALGCRQRRLPGGQFPARLERVERQVPRHACAATGRATAASSAEFARRFTGSADLYEASGRKPHASINFITAHDGFTLQDLVSYNDKHNEANGEENRDGHNDNRSWNCGVEGPTDDPAILALRARQKRNLLATLLLSQGVPMLLAGDELGRTQQRQQQRLLPGQRAVVDRLDADDEEQEAFLEFVARLIRLRRQHPVFSRRRYVRADTVTAEGLKEILWLTPDGREMTESDWNQEFARCLGVYLAGGAIERRGSRGKPIKDSNFLLLFNAHHETIPFKIAENLSAKVWLTVLDTAASGDPFAAKPLASDNYPLQGRSLVLLEESGSKVDVLSEVPGA